MMPCFFFTIESLAGSKKVSTEGQRNCSYSPQRQIKDGGRQRLRPASSQFFQIGRAGVACRMPTAIRTWAGGLPIHQFNNATAAHAEKKARINSKLIADLDLVNGIFHPLLGPRRCVTKTFWTGVS
jgi:hypothetical protein